MAGRLRQCASLRARAIRSASMERDAERSRPDRTARPAPLGRNGRPEVGQERGEDGQRLLQAEGEGGVGRDLETGQRVGLALPQIADAAERGEGERRSIPGHAGAALEALFHPFGAELGAVVHDDAWPQGEREARGALVGDPALAELRDDVALLVGRQQRLVGVREDLALFVHDDARGLGRAHGVRERDLHRAPERHRRLRARDGGFEPLGFFEEISRRRRVAAEVRDGDAQREQAGEQPGVARGARGLDALVEPALGVGDATALPRRVRRVGVAAQDAGRVAHALVDLEGGLDLLERAVEVAGGAERGAQEGASLGLDGVGPLALVDEGEHRLGGADGVVGAEGGERAAGELEAVLEDFVGDVGLRVVMHELHAHAREPAGVLFLEVLGDALVQRPAAPPRQLGVEDLAHRAAREGEAIAAAFALLLEVAATDQLLEGVVEVDVLLLEQRLELVLLERFAEHGGERQHLAQLVGQALDAALDGLLDRRRDGLEREVRAAREGEGAARLALEAPGVEQRTKQLPREEGVSLGGVVEPLGERGVDGGADRDRLEELAVLREGEAVEVEQGEALVALEPVDELGQRVAPVDLGGGEGADEERARRAEAARDVLESLNRRARRVQILEHEDDWLVAGDACDGARQEIEDGDAIVLARRRVGARDARGA